METLVSVVVLTYNSAEFVIETLESIKNQDYKNLEIIVSDDCSKDNTIEICRAWLEENETRFFRTELITVSENTGTTRNFNRSLQAAKGEWIRSIAGDDAFHHSCISNNIKYISNHPDSKVIISRYRIYNSSFQESNILGTRPADDFLWFFELEVQEQLKVMRTRGEHLILGMFVKTSVLRSVNGCDERFKLLEDLPLLINLLANGHKFNYLPVVTTYYRRNVDTVSNQKSTTYKLLLKEMIRAYRWFRRPYLGFTEVIDNDIYFINEYLLVNLFKGEINNRRYKLLRTFISQLSPLHHKRRKEIRRSSSQRN